MARTKCTFGNERKLKLSSHQRNEKKFDFFVRQHKNTKPGIEIFAYLHKNVLNSRTKTLSKAEILLS